MGGVNTYNPHSRLVKQLVKKQKARDPRIRILKKEPVVKKE